VSARPIINSRCIQSTAPHQQPAAGFAGQGLLEGGGEVVQGDGVGEYVVEALGQQVGGEAGPDAAFPGHRAVGGGDAEQADAADDARHHRGRQLRGLREADADDIAPRLCRCQQRRRRFAAEVVYRAAPLRRAERAGGHLHCADDARGAEFFQIIPRHTRVARGGDGFVAES